MRRVLVIGCPGAGKSTLTRALAETLGLPAVYLDRLWWKSGWINRTRAEFDARLDAALAGDAWVMDGNYLRTLPRRLELLDGWKGEAHIFRSPAQCAAFLAQQKNQNTPGME